MSDLKYTKEHEWIRFEGDVATVGITPYAQEQLGDVVYVELPEIGKVVKQSAQAAVVESVKAASEVYAPLSGKVIETNQTLAGEPQRVNADPTGAGWFFKIRLSDVKEIDTLMDRAAYDAYIAGLH